MEIKQIFIRTLASVRSDQLPVNRGVPQGSVLGPVLFVLFTADFPAYTEMFCNTIMYADDTVLVTSHKNKEVLEIQSYIALNMAAEYCIMNDLVFNESKTKQLNIGIMREDVSVFPNIECVEATRHLGVVIDSTLSWVEHVDGLCSRLSSALFALRRVKCVSTTDAIRTTYNSLFESSLRYGVVIWGAAAYSNLKRVLVIQKRAIRMLADLEWRDSCRRAFIELKILTVVGIYLLEVISLALSMDIQRNANAHSYNTRNAQDFILAVHRTGRFQRKPTYAGSRFFNILPNEVKRTSPKSFRRKLLEWLIQRPFYSVDEFIDWPNFHF